MSEFRKWVCSNLGHVWILVATLVYVSLAIVAFNYQSMILLWMGIALTILCAEISIFFYTQKEKTTLNNSQIE